MDDLSSARRNGGVRLVGLLVGLWALVGVAAQGRADPIPKGTHDRKLDIRLTPEAVARKVGGLNGKTDSCGASR